MLEKINVGAYANDGNGDPLRDAFVKVNDNFTELGNVLSVVTANTLVVNLTSQQTTLTSNNSLTFRLASNTSLVISVRDNYGNTRNVTLTLT